LVIFAGVQVALQARHERRRRGEREEDRDEKADRAFQYAWAEHFRLEGLADRVGREDLIEMALLGVLRPASVLPHEWGELTRAFATLSPEAGYLGGVAAALCHDVERSIGIFVGSVTALAKQAPGGFTQAQKTIWIREQFSKDLEPWEESIRIQVRELSRLLWDACKHSPRAHVVRDLDFEDELASEFGRAAVESLEQRAGEQGNVTPVTPDPRELPPAVE
jgi:hypothetical protein